MKENTKDWIHYTSAVALIISSLQFAQSDYRTLELVSVKHPVHTSYYCWMLVNAQE